MKKFIAVIVLAAMSLIGTAFAETTMDELEKFVDRCTWFDDLQTINDEISVLDIDCYNHDNGKEYHFVLVVEGSESEGNWTAQLIVTERNKGWIGNWYAHNVDQFEEDWIEIVTEMYEGTL